jgi:hypothetical protein
LVRFSAEDCCSLTTAKTGGHAPKAESCDAAKMRPTLLARADEVIE